MQVLQDIYSIKRVSPSFVGLAMVKRGEVY